MDRTNIYGVDAKNIDFSGIDLSNSIFDTVDLANSKLTPNKFVNFYPAIANWWESKEIDPDLLEILISKFYPSWFAGEVIFSDIPITKEYYAHRISVLCPPARATCKEENLHFEGNNFTIEKRH